MASLVERILRFRDDAREKGHGNPEFRVWDSAWIEAGLDLDSDEVLIGGCKVKRVVDGHGAEVEAFASEDG